MRKLCRQWWPDPWGIHFSMSLWERRKSKASALQLKPMTSWLRGVCLNKRTIGYSAAVTQKLDSPNLLIAETLTCDLQVETSLRCTHSKLSFSFPIVRSFSGMFRLDNLPIKKFKRCPSFFFRFKEGLQKLLTSKKKTSPFKICSFGKKLLLWWWWSGGWRSCLKREWS